ncbi:MAG: hypothetical protein LBT36_03720, partial [Oscillospiraceae bacterium]|nr:hypothetical protein [Oscillospiraceae bacterium]
MLIAVDHGNKQIKVNGTNASRSFTSGLTESATLPPFGEDILRYNGRYYSLSEKRVPYTPDKTRDDRFYILTLFAVAFELAASGRFAPGETADVQLAVGLPPAHYGRLYERFEAYFTRGGTERFTFRGKPYAVRVTDTVAYPQAYAAAMTVY